MERRVESVPPSEPPSALDASSDGASDDASSRSCAVAVALYAVLVGYLTVRDFGATAYDDSYFFKRFALNALDHGVFAWNVDEGPIFGSTSQLFQLVATAVTAVTRTHYVVAVRGLNAAALVVAYVLLARWNGRATNHPAHGHALALVALGSPIVVATVLTGMETAITLALLSWVLTRLLDARDDAELTVAPWHAAALTVAVYLCRPDAAVIVGSVVLVRALGRRTLPLAYLAWLTGGMVVVVAACWAYYGTPLPLSFYMKSLALNPYGAHMMGLSWDGKQAHFGITLAFSAPLLWVVVRSGTLRDRGATLALLVGVLALWAYHLMATNEIMGYRARFYLPAVVALGMAAARSWDAFVARERAGTRWPTVAMVVLWIAAVVVGYWTKTLPTHEGFFISQVPWVAYAGTMLAAAFVVLWLPGGSPGLGPWVVTVALGAGLVGWKPPGKVDAPNDRQVMHRHARQVTTVRGIFDVARCLPADRSVYHSEMGVTGLVLLDRRVVDLAGIVSRGPGIDREPFQVACQRDQPAAIFLPHRNYRRLNAEIEASACFSDYARAVKRSSSPLYVRREFFDGFMACATEPQRYLR